jgi:hypothetical protein
MAGQAAGDAGQGAALADSEAQGNGGADINALVGQLAGMQDTHEQLRAFLQENPDGGHWPEEGDEQPLDLEGGDPFGDEGLDAFGLEDAGFDPGEQFGGDPQADAEAQAQALQQFVGDQVQQAVQPLAAQVHDGLQAQAFGELAREFSELQEPETAERVMGLARSIGDAHGWPAQVWQSPQFVRLTYLAARAQQIAQEEAALDGEQPPTAAIEGGGGAMGGAGRGRSPGQMIVGAGSRNPLPFK